MMLLFCSCFLLFIFCLLAVADVVVAVAVAAATKSTFYSYTHIAEINKQKKILPDVLLWLVVGSFKEH